MGRKRRASRPPRSSDSLDPPARGRGPPDRRSGPIAAFSRLGQPAGSRHRSFAQCGCRQQSSPSRSTSRDYRCRIGCHGGLGRCVRRLSRWGNLSGTSADGPITPRLHGPSSSDRDLRSRPHRCPAHPLPPRCRRGFSGPRPEASTRLSLKWPLDRKRAPIVWITGGDGPLLRPAIDGNAQLWPEMTLEGLRLAVEAIP